MHNLYAWLNFFINTRCTHAHRRERTVYPSNTAVVKKITVLLLLCKKLCTTTKQLRRFLRGMSTAAIPRIPGTTGRADGLPPQKRYHIQKAPSAISVCACVCCLETIIMKKNETTSNGDEVQFLLRERSSSEDRSSGFEMLRTDEQVRKTG